MSEPEGRISDLRLQTISEFKKDGGLVWTQTGENSRLSSHAVARDFS
jgi:hypothetical protein